jgi:hypothetical protein
MHDRRLQATSGNSNPPIDLRAGESRTVPALAAGHNDGSKIHVITLDRVIVAVQPHRHRPTSSSWSTDERPTGGWPSDRFRSAPLLGTSICVAGLPIWQRPESVCRAVLALAETAIFEFAVRYAFATLATIRRLRQWRVARLPTNSGIDRHWRKASLRCPQAERHAEGLYRNRMLSRTVPPVAAIIRKDQMLPSKLLKSRLGVQDTQRTSVRHGPPPYASRPPARSANLP